MSQDSAIARPYAKAAFEYAVEHKAIAGWSAMLQAASVVVKDPQMFRLFADPRVSTQKMADLILKICEKVTAPATTNFIRLLAENKRLKVLPEIASLFEVLRNEYEHKMDVKVKSAYPLGDSDQKRLSDALQKYLNCQIMLHCETDENLIGGVVISAGDRVIDGSVRGWLSKLSSEMRV